MQKELDGLNRWAKSSNTKLSKFKCQVLYLGLNSLRQSFRLGKERLHSNQAGKEPSGSD